ncbi:MAG TPA: RNA polymerase factor sigma-32 [Myxococcales bacterium]|nr:RNA polymerase factor sigma-32 [Myxococcales bacterium]
MTEPINTADSLSRYMEEVAAYPLVTADEEKRLARQYRRANDKASAERLITANLRFVVKIAYEYRSHGLPMQDLIQEGNLGLIRAVEKFNPDKNIRLISYAVWWIRAFIQNHILHSWSLVKVGTTQAQRRLFFGLARARREIARHDGSEPDPQLDRRWIAKRLKVREEEVVEMEARLSGRDCSLDAPLDSEDHRTTHGELLPHPGVSQEALLGDLEATHLTAKMVQQALTRLDPRERAIVELRLMAEAPMTLTDVGRKFGFSRERARQLETRARNKLKSLLEAALAEAQLPVAETAQLATA